MDAALKRALMPKITPQAALRMHMQHFTGIAVTTMTLGTLWMTTYFETWSAVMFPEGRRVKSPGLGNGGIYNRGQPTAQDQFRANTEKHAKMAGVQYGTFTCACCGKPKPLLGRKRVNSKYPQKRLQVR